MKIDQKNEVFTKDVYYSYLSNSIDFSINPLVVGFEKCRPTKQEIVSNKTCYIIHYVLSGEGTLTFKDKTYNITKNNSCAEINVSNEFLNYGDEKNKLKIINSIVNTLTNLKEINSIKFLINGELNNNLSEVYLKNN